MAAEDITDLKCVRKLGIGYGAPNGEDFQLIVAVAA